MEPSGVYDERLLVGQAAASPSTFPSFNPSNMLPPLLSHLSPSFIHAAAARLARFIRQIRVLL